MTRNRFISTIAGLLVCFTITLGMILPMKSLADAPAAEMSAQQGFNSVVQGLASGNAELLIPILAIVFVFGGPVIIVVTLVLQHYRSQKSLAEHRRECIAKLIDAGRDVPESLLYFDDLGQEKNPERDLSRGIKNIGLGVGIAIFLAAVSSLKASTFGLILVGLGCAQLLSWKLTRNAA